MKQSISEDEREILLQLTRRIEDEGYNILYNIETDDTISERSYRKIEKQFNDHLFNLLGILTNEIHSL